MEPKKLELVNVVTQFFLFFVSVILSGTHFEKNEFLVLVGKPQVKHHMLLQTGDEYYFNFKLEGGRIKFNNGGSKVISLDSPGLGKKHLILAVLIAAAIVMAIIFFLNNEEEFDKRSRKIGLGILILSVIYGGYSYGRLTPPDTANTEVFVMVGRDNFLKSAIIGPYQKKYRLVENRRLEIRFYCEDSNTFRMTDTEKSEYRGGTVIKEPPNQPINDSENSNICVSIFNLSAFPNAGNKIGVLLRNKFGIKFEDSETFFKRGDREYANTVIYYEKVDYRDLALQIADYLPGEQSVGEITTNIRKTLKRKGFTTFKNIVILLGNDIENLIK